MDEFDYQEDAQNKGDANMNYNDNPHAPPVHRILAGVIDSAVALILWLVLSYFGGFIGAVYIVVKDGLPFLNGQSLGKKAVGLQAVDQEGKTLLNNWGPEILRNVVLLIPFFPIVELVVFLTNDDRLRLGDHLAKTKVIKVQKTSLDE